MDTDNTHRRFEDENASEAFLAAPALLSCLHCDLNALREREISRAHFEWLWPGAQAERWQGQQRAAPSYSCAYFDLTCLLAYYGIEYPANIGRLLEPYRRYRQTPQILAAQQAWESLHGLPNRLAIVYGKQRDASLLHLLLELRLPTCHLRHAHLEAIGSLWDQHRIGLLRAAGHSPAAQRALARALIHLCGTVGEPTLWHACYRHLQDAIYLRERRLGWTAQQTISLLRCAERRFACE